MFTRFSTSFSAGLLSIQMAPSLHCCTDLFLPRCRPWQMPLNFMLWLSVHFSSLLRPFSKILLCINISPQLSIISEFAENALHPITQVINKIIKQCQFQPWSMREATNSSVSHIHAQAPKIGPPIVLFMGKVRELSILCSLMTKEENGKCKKYSSLKGLTRDKRLGRVRKIVTFWIIEVKMICRAIKYSCSVQLWRVFIQNSYILPDLLGIKLAAIALFLCWTLKEEWKDVLFWF